MKVQCSCGTKTVFDITEEMRTNPVRFACPACGQDASEFVDSLIRQALGQNSTPTGLAVNIVPAAAPGSSGPPSPSQIPSVTSPLAAPPSPPPPARVRINVSRQSASTLTIHGKEGEEVREKPTLQEAAPVRKCPKHPSEVALETCRVCSKPICPLCMELFGYVCSPLCRARAASHGIELPVFKGQKSRIEQRRWRKVIWTLGTVGTPVLALLGFYIWYAWFGLLPKQIFSIRFAEPAHSGQSAFSAPDQLIYLHGGTLARHDIRQNKQMWSSYLIDKDEIKREVARETEQAKALISKANSEAWENMPKMPDPEKLTQSLERQSAASLALWVRGQNVWVLSSDKLRRYDWATGKAVQEVQLPANGGGLICRGDELLALQNESGRSAVMSVNLTSCDSRTTELQQEQNSRAGLPRKEAASEIPKARIATSRNAPKAGLPTGIPGRDAGKVMDPAKVAAQAQKLSLPNRIALPAILANSWSQERTLAELDDGSRTRNKIAPAVQPVEQFTLIPTKNGYIEFSARLIERKVISHSTISPRPAKSVLEGPVNVTQSTEVANEILNEMQRERGGGVIEEDVSRYSVTLRRSGMPESWTGEVVGQPSLLALETVNVLAANKTLIVFDKTNKKLWQTALNFNLSADLDTRDSSPSYGHGPCVEQKGTLYVFDPGVLSAFDLQTGIARWRLPSVGITGLFFDDQGMLYVNTTTDNPGRIKTSHQIDISHKTIAVVLKVSPTNGKIIWSSQTSGLVNYVSGKFIYTVQSYMPDEEEDNPYRQETGFEVQPHMRIKRLNPRNGHEMWEHFQQRAPLDVQFDKNYIRLVFKKEVQVLRSITW